MNINIRLIKNFTTQYNKMLSEYGDEMARLNGFSDAQLSYTDFIDNFVDKQVVADISIDGNSNVGHKDIVSLENEMSKPHSKLLAFNKIYYELNKMYDFKTANDWLRNEWDGHLYLHDAYNSTMKPYCVLPSECCAFILNGKKIYASLEQIYEMLEEKEIWDYNQDVFLKRPNNLMVLDYDPKTQKSRYTKVTCISNKETEKDFYFTKATNGMSLITTEDHSFISDEKEIEAKSLQRKDIIYTTFDKDLFTYSLNTYNGLELTEDLGWLIGVYLAEGYNQKGQLSICQSKEKSPYEWNKIIRILENIGIPFTAYEDRNIIRLKNGDNNWERKILTIAQGKYCDEKKLCPDFIHFNKDFLRGFISGIIDGDGTIADNRTCMIRLTSRTLINQIRLIGLSFGGYFSDRLPYIQSQNAKIQQKRPMYTANVNMNRNKEFFLSLNSRKIQEKYTHFDYDEKFANKNYICKLNDVEVKDSVQTYKTSEKVFDLSTESHTFVCNGILIHNCYAYDLEELVTKGLYFIENFNAQPPQHLNTYTDFVGEFVSWACNRSSGAVGLPSFLVYSYYFWKKDCKSGHTMGTPEYYRDQEFQRIIYKLNQPYLRGGIQSAFTNFSIFDHPYMEALFGGKSFPDGTLIMDSIDEIVEYQKNFMEVVSKIRSQNMMTFPVLTYALLKVTPGPDGWVDKPFARWCSNHNMKWGDSNFFNSSDVTSLSNCCRLISNVKNLG